jgi:hypothetical protein
MALSGVLNSTDYQGRYIQFSWDAKQDTTKNQSTITWTLKGAGKATSGWYNAGPFYVSIAGEEKTSPTRIALAEDTPIMSGTKVITHNTEGKASFTVTIKAAIYQSSYNCSGSGTFTLDTIPRKATITSAPDFNDESSPTVNFSNPAKGSLQIGIYKTDGSTPLVAYRAASGSSYKFTFTAAEKTALQNACLTSSSMSVRFYLKTTIGSNTFYHYVTKTLYITNAIPTLAPTAIEHQDADGIKNTTATGSNQRWVKGYSDIAYAFNASAKKGATIAYYNVICGSKTESGKASGVLYNVDSKDVVFQVVDSRGNRATQVVSGALVDYFRPTCSLSVKAALEEETSAKCTLTIGGNFFNGQVKAGENNTPILQYRYKEDRGEYGSWTALTPTIDGNKYSITHVLSGLDYQKTYTFQACVQDKFYLAHGSYIFSGEIAASAKPVFDWSKSDFHFNVPVRLKSGMALQGVATDGNVKNMMYLNSADNITIGGGAYPPEHVLISTKDNAGDVHINGRIYGQNKVLWSGAVYMQDGQEISLNEAISKQPSGIVLVFSRYTPGAENPINNHNFSYHFVPKIMLNYLYSGGSTFNMSTNAQELFASKYLYFTDTSIKGHANNTASGTGANGIKYSNNMFVLRYVIGV